MPRTQTPPKGRPTPKRDRTPTRQQTPEPTATPEPTSRVLGIDWLPVLTCGSAALIHTVAVYYLAARLGGDLSAAWLVLAAAPIATAVFVPQARRGGWHRWLALYGLTYVTYVDMLPLVLVVAETWILHRFWVLEGTPRLPGRKAAGE